MPSSSKDNGDIVVFVCDEMVWDIDELAKALEGAKSLEFGVLTAMPISRWVLKWLKFTAPAKARECHNM